MANVWQRSVISVDHDDAALQVKPLPAPLEDRPIIQVEPSTYGDPDWLPGAPVRLRAGEGWRFFRWRDYLCAWAGSVIQQESRRVFSSEGAQPPDPAACEIAEVRLRRNEGAEPLRLPSGVPLRAVLGEKAQEQFRGGGFGVGKVKVERLRLTDAGVAWTHLGRECAVKPHLLAYVRLEVPGVAALLPTDRIKVTYGDR